MAGSFNIFRKNQKILLAALTLLSMFAFVFLDPLFRYLGSSQAPQNPVVVETNYGNLKRSDIEALISDRRLVDHFVSGVIALTVDKLIDQQKADPRSRETYIKLFSDQWRQRLMQRAGATDEAQAVETMLLARRAEQMGMVVSDAAVNQLIREISGDELNSRELASVTARLHVGEQRLFDALRTEMAASRVMQLFSASIEGVPPAQRFDYFNRLNRRATIEAAAVPVADFVDKVKDPDDATLKAFFEEHKHQIAVPGSPEPGFKIPRRERFQYFKAEYDIFRELAEVSDEEVQKYYDEHKATMFRKLELPKDKPEDKADEVSDKAEKSDAEEKSDAASKPGEPAEPAAESSKPAEKSEPAADAPAEQSEPESAKPEETEAKPDGVASRRTMKFRLVADTKETEADGAPAESTPAEPAKAGPADTKQEPDQAETKPEADKSEADKPAVEPQYEPLEKVREQIVNAIKSEKAQGKIQAAIEALSARMRGYSDARDVYLVEKDTKSNAKPPTDLDFVALAKQQSVAYGETRLASAVELANSELGKSFASVRGELPFQFRAAPYTEVAFGPKNGLYSNVTTHDADGNVYLSWKVEQAEERVPTFDEVREEVLKAWKMIQARDLARKQAETYAAEAKGEGKSLTEALASGNGPKVITAGPFSWMTTGSTPDQGQGSVLMYSEVPGIENPGAAFMEAVFSLSKGAAGVAVNQPQDIYYAVEVKEFDPPQSELEEDFARQDFHRYMNVAMTDTRQTYQAWVNSISEQAGVKWLQEPVQRNENNLD